MTVWVFSLESDLLDIELCEGLSVACLHSVVLLAAHLEDSQFGSLQVLHNLCLDGGLLQIGFANLELAILLDCQNSA